MQASEVPVMRRVNRIVEGREQTGFWLPVDWVEAFPEEHLGESTLRIWMQYDDEFNRFLGSISLCNPTMLKPINSSQKTRMADGT